MRQTRNRPFQGFKSTIVAGRSQNQNGKNGVFPRSNTFNGRSKQFGHRQPIDHSFCKPISRGQRCGRREIGLFQWVKSTIVAGKSQNQNGKKAVFPRSNTFNGRSKQFGHRQPIDHSFRKPISRALAGGRRGIGLFNESNRQSWRARPQIQISRA